MHRFLTLLTLCLCSCALAASEFADISYDDLVKAIAAKNVAILDVNGSDSWKKGHLPGALNFEGCADITTCLPADKGALIVAYCGGPACGAWKKGAQAAVAKGYTNVKHYSGGLTGWKEAGGTLEEGTTMKCPTKTGDGHTMQNEDCKL